MARALHQLKCDRTSCDDAAHAPQRQKDVAGLSPPDALMQCSILSSPLGDLIMWGEAGVLTGLEFTDSSQAAGVEARCDRDDGAFADVAAQLRAYFAGELRTFDVRLVLHGTAFQQRVWNALRDIPYGATTTYGTLAVGLGNPKSMRAVGLANGRNPISIIIPCHRVIGADGSLVGYGGGMQRKEWLLAHESGARRLPW
jgi:methylated-DNA-[protein]-cysteine S-methyltransferase